MHDVAYQYWKQLGRQGGPSDCVPMAIAMVECISFEQAKHACELFEPGGEGRGYHNDCLQLAVGRLLT